MGGRLKSYKTNSKSRGDGKNIMRARVLRYIYTGLHSYYSEKDGVFLAGLYAILYPSIGQARKVTAYF